ncbi:MAG: trehalose-phosphatase, partial [Rhodanobacter sp.]
MRQLKSTSTATPPVSLPKPPLPAMASTPARAQAWVKPWVLLLDVDGTLLEFADDPAAVAVDADLHEVLRGLHRTLGGALALVSGRELADIDRLFGEPGWVVVGLHGLQQRAADGRVRTATVDTIQREQLHRAVHALAQRFPQVRVEDKHAAMALHCREAPTLWPALQAACVALLPTLPGYELQPGNLVLEFKPAGSDKGQAVRELLATPWGSDHLPVYVGDDLTDEHAFAVVNAAGG